MLFYVANDKDERLIEIEVFFTEIEYEKTKVQWFLDVQSYVYCLHLIPDSFDIMKDMSDEEKAKYLNDINDIQEFRGYVHEILRPDYDRNDILSKSTQKAKKLVESKAEEILRSFAEKYNLKFNID